MLYRHGGAGNNWAMGYQMCSGDFLDSSINCLRRELECCDLPPMLLTIHSTAGGTGSGLGTRITEAMCEEFSDVTRMNISITPYHFGEVVVQHYNSVLSLAKISAASNAVLTFENEVAQDLCKKMRRIERPTIEDINQTITASLVPILLPKYSTRRSDTSGRIASHLQDDVADLCSHPGFRFLDVSTRNCVYLDTIALWYSVKTITPVFTPPPNPRSRQPLRLRKNPSNLRMTHGQRYFRLWTRCMIAERRLILD